MSDIVIPIGADHRGYALKTRLVSWLAQNGYRPKDLGAHDAERCDALDYARALASELDEKAAPLGILICGSGQAMAMTANRYRHVRAALCANVAMAQTTRAHNDANVLVLGADFTPEGDAVAILEAFLGTQFLGGRYAGRRDALTALGGL